MPRTDVADVETRFAHQLMRTLIDDGKKINSSGILNLVLYPAAYHCRDGVSRRRLDRNVTPVVLLLPIPKESSASEASTSRISRRSVSSSAISPRAPVACSRPPPPAHLIRRRTPRVESGSDVQLFKIATGRAEIGTRSPGLCRLGWTASLSATKNLPTLTRSVRSKRPRSPGPPEHDW